MPRPVPVQLRTLGLLWLAVASVAPAAEIYKSVDANGNVVYSDHADPAAARTSLVHLQDSRYPPEEMHVCGTQNCFTLRFDDGSYRRVDGSDDIWTVVTFTPQTVVLRRHGTATANTDVTYSGEVADDRLINVKVDGKPTGGVDASWGIALNTLPGSNAERDADQQAMMDVPAGGTMSTAATPPPLPPEEQADIPEPGYLWTPGFWYWRVQGYFWVPGRWVRPPQTGLLWTPAFWGLAGSLFVFHPGYWGPTVGFYGGVNYGHGYFGSGYSGGRWVAGSFAYNSSVNRLSDAIKNRYFEPPTFTAAGGTKSSSFGSNTPLGTRSANVSTPPRAQPSPVLQRANATVRQAAPVHDPVAMTANVPNRPSPTANGAAAAPAKPNRLRPARSPAPRT